MNKILKNSKTLGLPPGEAVYLGNNSDTSSLVEQYFYDDKTFEESSCSSFKDLKYIVPEDKMCWLNINGINNAELIKNVGEKFGLHKLTIEDILNTDQRPKFEEIEDYILVSIKMLRLENGDIINEHVSVVVKDNMVITFQEKEGDVFEFIRNRLRKNTGIIRKMHSDYLGYAVIDAIVDYYFIILEEIEHRIDDLEEKMLTNFNSSLLEDLHEIKRGIIAFKKGTWPVREIISSLEKSAGGLISNKIDHYLRDLYDHVIQVLEGIESNKDKANDLMNLYLSLSGNRMNEIMKILTVMSTVFIPLTFLTGLYGMNFKFMPELGVHWAYPFLLVLMTIIVFTMFIYFKKKNWF